MKLKLVLFRLVTLIALAACCASFLDYILPSPAFCGFKAGCEAVTHSAFGRLLGVPLPVWGLLAFGGFYLLALFPNRPIAKLLGPAAILAGLAGLGLVLLQVFVIKQLCPLCLITDAAAILLMAVEIGFAPPKEGRAEVPLPRRWLWTGALILAMGAPLLWPVIKPIPPVPEQVQAYWTADKITVVEVTDFECPHCRQTHAPLREFLERHADRIRFVRLVKPMDQHANAKSAARAYLCADAQIKAREMAEALFALEQLSPEACQQAAESVGLDMDEYQQCVASSETDERIGQLTGFVDQSDVQGLPVIWIEDQRLVGEQTLESLEAALARAERRKR